MDGVGFPARFFFHFAFNMEIIWKVQDFYKELQYHPYPPLDFASVKGMDGRGFLKKFAVSSITSSDLSNLFFVPVWIFLRTN